jgi:hypothetical protein
VLDHADNESGSSALTDLDRVELADPDEAPALEHELVSQLGDMWLLGNHRLFCGDGT